MAQLNGFGIWIILTIAFAGFQHLPWWVPALAAIARFAWYQFDKASIGIAQVVRNGGGLLAGVRYLTNLAFGCLRSTKASIANPCCRSKFQFGDIEIARYLTIFDLWHYSLLAEFACAVRRQSRLRVPLLKNLMTDSGCVRRRVIDRLKTDGVRIQRFSPLCSISKGHWVYNHD